MWPKASRGLVESGVAARDSSLADSLFHFALRMFFFRSPLLGACNSRNEPMQRHFYRPVYF